MNKFLEVAVKIATEAGQMILKNYSEEVLKDWKADGTPVTETDKSINTYVINELTKNFPDHRILGEEEDGKGNDTAEYVWLCDPIDGTVPFSHGTKLSTFSLALVYNGRPIVAVINSPFENRLFTATTEENTKMNGEVVLVGKQTQIANSVIHAEVPANELYLATKIRELAGFPVVYQSFVYGALRVVTGHYAASIFGYGKPYDCAAIKLIIEKAGGRTSNYKGEDQRYDQQLAGFICSNGLVHEEVMGIFAE